MTRAAKQIADAFQDELDDMRRKADDKSDLRSFIKSACRSFVPLLDHIAQLTAERDEAHEKLRFSESKREEDYKKYVLDMADAADRTAELETAAPDLTWFWEIVDRYDHNGVPSDEPNALARICNELAQARKRIAELEAQLSAKFISGMMRSVEIAITYGDENCICGFIAKAILAEAALKGEGE